VTVRHESLEDHGGDEEADDRIRDLEAGGEGDRARDDAERDETVDARVVPVGDERGTCKAPSSAKPDLRCDLVAGEADQAGDGEREQVGERLRIEEALNRLDTCDARRDEDGEHDEQARDPLGAP